MSKLIQTQDAAVSRQELQEQIRKSVKDAQQAAENAVRAQAEQIQSERGVLAVPSPPIPPGPLGTPGVVVRTFPDDLPPRVENIAISFFIMIAVIAIGLPLMRAIARRIERGTPVAPLLPREVSDQLQHITQSVDAIAIEVERISEGQRFTTKMLAERSREGTA